jgi:hypothetical protein
VSLKITCINSSVVFSFPYTTVNIFTMLFISSLLPRCHTKASLSHLLRSSCAISSNTYLLLGVQLLYIIHDMNVYSAWLWVIVGECRYFKSRLCIDPICKLLILSSGQTTLHLKTCFSKQK